MKSGKKIRDNISNQKALKQVLKAIHIDAQSAFARSAFHAVLKLLPPVPRIPGADVCFELARKVVPLIIELIFIRDGKAFLIYRKDEYWNGWHFPGGYREPRTTLINDCKRLARMEVGAHIHIKGVTEIKLIEHPDGPRHHDACLLVLCEFDGELEGGRWFARKPADIISYHRPYWTAISKFLH